MAIVEKDVVSPKGSALYAFLEKPDTKFNPDGDFKVNLRIPVDDAGDLVNMIDGYMEESYEDAVKQAKKEKKPEASVKRADPPYRVGVDDDGNQFIEFRFKTSSVGKNKEGEVFTKVMRISDKQGNMVPQGANLNIGNGTIMRVKFDIGTYYTQLVGAGVTLYPKAVQIFKLEKYKFQDFEADEAESEDDDFVFDVTEDFKAQPAKSSQEEDESVPFDDQMPESMQSKKDDGDF